MTEEVTTRAVVGATDSVYAEYSCRPLTNDPYCFAELLGDECIAIGGYPTFAAAEYAAIKYGFEKNAIEVYYGPRDLAKRSG